MTKIVLLGLVLTLTFLSEASSAEIEKFSPQAMTMMLRGLKKYQVAYKPGSVHKTLDLRPVLLDDYSSGTPVASRL